MSLNLLGDALRERWGPVSRWSHHNALLEVEDLRSPSLSRREVRAVDGVTYQVEAAAPSPSSASPALARPWAAAPSWPAARRY